MANNWDEFVKEYAQDQYDEAVFHLNGHVTSAFNSPIERVMSIALYDDFGAYAPDIARLEKQKKIGKYTVDFYLAFETDSGLVEFVIECDGHEFHEKTKKQAQHDKKRDRFLTSEGYVVLRYTGYEILKDYKVLTDPIWRVIANKDMDAKRIN